MHTKHTTRSTFAACGEICKEDVRTINIRWRCLVLLFLLRVSTEEVFQSANVQKVFHEEQALQYLSKMEAFPYRLFCLIKMFSWILFLPLHTVALCACLLFDELVRFIIWQRRMIYIIIALLRDGRTSWNGHGKSLAQNEREMYTKT